MVVGFTEDGAKKIIKHVQEGDAVGRDETPEQPVPPGRPRDPFAIVELTATGSADGWYQAREVLSDDPNANPPSWRNKTPGRSFGVAAGDEGEVLHPLLITGLETTESGADPIYMIRRVIHRGGSTFWMIVGAAGSGKLPPPVSEYMVLQLQGDPLVPVWDYVRLVTSTP